MSTFEPEASRIGLFTSRSFRVSDGFHGTLVVAVPIASAQRTLPENSLRLELQRHIDGEWEMFAALTWQGNDYSPRPGADPMALLGPVLRVHSHDPIVDQAGRKIGERQILDCELRLIAETPGPLHYAIDLQEVAV
jgi:hypothetical protein